MVNGIPHPFVFNRWEFLHNQGQNPDDNEVIKEAKERQHSLQNAAFQHRDELLKKSLEKSDEHRIVFANLNEKIAILKRIGIQFDVIVFDHAEKFAEYYCWRAALPMVICVQNFFQIYVKFIDLNNPCFR